MYLLLMLFTIRNYFIDLLRGILDVRRHCLLNVEKFGGNNVEKLGLYPIVHTVYVWYSWIFLLGQFAVELFYCNQQEWVPVSVSRRVQYCP